MRDFIRCVVLSACALVVAGPVFAQDAPAAAAPEAAPAVAAAPAPEAAPAAEAAPAPEAAPAEAAPAPTPPPPAEKAAEEKPEEGEEEQCALGKVCLGPVVSAGLFNAIGVGVHARYEKMWGFGLDYQFLPISAGGVDLSLGLITLDGRIYPFEGAFFASLGFSYQYATLSTPAVDGDISIPQIKFGLGFMGHDGFVMGIDLAFGIPLGSSDADITVTDPTDPDSAKQSADITDAADVFVNLLPLTFQLNLIRIGYLF